MTGRKYALIKDYALNSYMRVLTSLYGTCAGERCEHLPGFKYTVLHRAFLHFLLELV